MFLLYAGGALLIAVLASIRWWRTRFAVHKLVVAGRADPNRPGPAADRVGDPDSDADRERPSPPPSRLLVTMAALSLVPPILKAIFALAPTFEARALPIEVHMLLGDEFWIPFMVLFFATVMFAVPAQARRALLLAMWLAVALVISRSAWRLGEPAVYHSPVTATRGICMQSTDYTCGAASMVMLLDRLGIAATEGEMARLSVTVPRRGVSAFQAAYALREKFKQVEHPAAVEVMAGGADTLNNLPTPFLAGVKFRLWLDHMICVFEVGSDQVVAGDPLRGRVTYRREAFLDQWLGHAVVVQPAADTP